VKGRIGSRMGQTTIRRLGVKRPSPPIQPNTQYSTAGRDCQGIGTGYPANGRPGTRYRRP